MPKVRIDGSIITNWEAFHSECARALGFPNFYGRNMNAWIDCLTYIREGDGMSCFVLGPDEPLVMEIANIETFQREAPEVFQGFLNCTAAVNKRQVEMGQKPALQVLPM